MAGRAEENSSLEVWLHHTVAVLELLPHEQQFALQFPSSQTKRYSLRPIVFILTIVCVSASACDGDDDPSACTTMSGHVAVAFEITRTRYESSMASSRDISESCNTSILLANSFPTAEKAVMSVVPSFVLSSVS